MEMLLVHCWPQIQWIQWSQEHHFNHNSGINRSDNINFFVALRICVALSKNEKSMLFCLGSGMWSLMLTNGHRVGWENYLKGTLPTQSCHPQGSRESHKYVCHQQARTSHATQQSKYGSLAPRNAMNCTCWATSRGSSIIAMISNIVITGSLKQLRTKSSFVLSSWF